MALLSLAACTSTSSVVDAPHSAVRHPATATVSPPPVSTPRPSLARLPLAFEPNVGQARAGVRYVSRSAGMRLDMTDDGVQLVGAGKRAVGLRLVGANGAATVSGDAQLPGRAHYYTTTDRAGWRTDVPMYGRVVYRDVYPSIDLVFHGDAGQLEFDFVVQPGGDPRAIRLDVTGADAVAVDGRDVVLRAGGETVRLHEPVVYQHAAAGRASVAGRFRLDGRRLAFDLGEYDRTRPLVIDPIVSYATYFGGSGSDSGRSIGVDSAGNMYVALGDAGGNRLIKLSADGRTLLYLVNLGDMSPSTLVTDASGNVYLQASCPYPRSGVTFVCPTLNSLTTGHAQSQGDSGAYVMKFSPGGALLFSTSMGGVGSAIPGGIAIDAAGNIYATAWDVYGGFPLTGPVFSRSGGEGGFHSVVEAIAADTSRFLYVVEFQTGNSFFAPRGIAVDGAGAVYLTGMIQNSLFPTTPGAFQPADLGFGGGVVAKIAPGGGSLAYSTYFGSNVSGANNINPTGIAVDSEGNAYIAGWVGNEPGLPIANALQPTRGGGFFDAFVARLNPAGSGLVFSTYLGGSGNDGDNGMVLVALDSSANVYVAGSTSSSDFPRRNELNFNDGSGGNFVTELTIDGQALVYSTFFANTSTSIAGMTVTATGTVFLTGWTTSLNTVNPYQATYAGLADAFIAKLEPSEPRVFITSPAAGATVSGTVWSDIWVDNYVGTSNTFTLSAGGTVLATGTGTNHVTLPWDSRSVADGSITLTATVRDAGGHVGTSTRNFVVRNGTTPTLAAAFTSPAEGTTVSGIVSIGMSETGASGTPITFTLTVDGTQVFTASGTATTASFNWNTAGVSAGAHTLGLTVRDGTGRVATATRSVTVAGSTPTLTAAFTSPASGATVSGVVSVGMSASGASGTPITFTLTLDGTQIYTTSGTVSAATFNWDTSTAAPGAHTLGLTVRDGAGRTATSTRGVTVAGATGSLGVFITSPAASSTVSGTVWSDIWVQGAAAGARTFTLSIGGVQLVTASDSGNHVTLPWDSMRVANGTQTLVATVRDATGNSGTGTRSLSVQNAGGGGTPTLAASFTAPAAGATLSGTVSVGMSATGASGTPIVFTLTVDGTQVFTVSGAATSVSFGWTTTSVGDGAHTLGLTVSDGAGRIATATRSVTVQNTTPPPPPPGSISVFITEPRGGATVSGTVWFTVWIQNAATGMKTYTLTEGGRTLATVNTESTGPVSVPWATTPSDNGARAPAVGVRDSAGATGSATINVTVAN